MRSLKITKSITERADNINRYFQDINKYPILNPKEELEIAKKSKLGDSEATNKLIQSNLRFVVSVAKQFQNQGLTLEDLINEGNIGLMMAVSRFEPDMGYKLISFAVHQIRQSILVAINDGKNIKLPIGRAASLKKINKIVTQLEQKYQRLPTSDEIGEVMGKNVDKLLKDKIQMSSLDSPLESGGEEYTLLDLIGGVDNNSEDEIILKEQLKEFFNSLSKEERRIIQLSYGIDVDRVYSLPEMANMFNKSTERVRQIKEKALLRLKSHPKIFKLKEYRLV